MERLKQIASEINDILNNRRDKIKLSFVEEGHIYYMLDEDNNIRDNYPSVSTVEKLFYTPFDSEGKALEKANGCVIEQQRLLKQWSDAGAYATNKGSRVHFELEKYILNKNNFSKIVREPLYECDSKQMKDSDRMIEAGKQFLDLMESRGCVLLDTEVVLGDPELGYVGQADNFWISYTKDKKSIGLIITDHKTNQVKNLTPQSYHGFLLNPFHEYRDYALTHYFLQLPLYGKLFLKMMEGSKYEDIKILGCILDSLRDDGTFEEYRVPKYFIDTILNMKLDKTELYNLKKH